MYLNFGDLGQNAKEYVEQYASKRQGNMQMESIADMKRFVEEYPEFRKLSSNVTKHVTLVGELSRKVGEENLLDVSELEQSLACNDNHSNDLKVCQIIRKGRVFLLTDLDSSNTHPKSGHTSRQQASTYGYLRPALLENSLQQYSFLDGPPWHDNKSLKA